MKRLLTVIKIACIIFGAIGVISFFILFHKTFFNFSFKIDPDLASNFGSFFGGYVGTIFSIFSILLILYSIVDQNIEKAKSGAKDRFFKMLDYHNENVRNLRVPHLVVAKKSTIEEGRRAFVVYKIQIKRLLEIVSDLNDRLDLELQQREIIDIAYICFYYGLDQKWSPFILEQLEGYSQKDEIVNEILNEIEKKKEELALGRTNQTGLSCYFRNMYLCIKSIDQDANLTSKEKDDLVRILRAQLSNPELYVIFFNLASRFGKKWEENGYLTNYRFLNNIPINYCDGFEPGEIFDISFEYEEY